MINSDDNTDNNNSDIPEVDYSNLPDEILKALEAEKYTIDKEVKLSWDGRQFIIRIPSEITTEMGINKENKEEYKVHFKYEKPEQPNKKDKQMPDISLIWTQPKNE